MEQKRFSWPEMKEITVISSNKGELKLDGYDAKNKIGYIYISIDDLNNWTNAEEYPNEKGSFYHRFALIIEKNINNTIKDKKIWVFYNFQSTNKSSARGVLRNQVQVCFNSLNTDS